MSHDKSSPNKSALADALQKTLSELIHNPYPYVPNPESCKKRASVALILRIRPHKDHWPETYLSQADSNAPSGTGLVDEFFEQSWVQHGDPEVVFIKRAARPGDRWTSHVALPGGKRDPEDEDDKATAVRETSEEIGLDLTSLNAFFVGNLPERVVSTSWGKVPIMVLCPFLFLWTAPEIPPLRLQPNEVASTHWVPLRCLLSPSTRTHEYVDVSDRFAHRAGPIIKSVIRGILGKMRFSAIKLIPSESLYCTSTAEFFSPQEENALSSNELPLSSRFYNWYLGDHAGSSDRQRPLLLWGLTLGMLADFLDQLPPNNSVQLWSYPTFTSLDVRFIIEVLTMNLKRRNRNKLKGPGQENQTAIDGGTEAVAITEGDNPWFIGGLSNGMKHQSKSKNAERTYAVGIMLDGYYDMARRGVWIAAGLRFAGVAALVWQAVRISKNYIR